MKPNLDNWAAISKSTELLFYLQELTILLCHLANDRLSWQASPPLFDSEALKNSYYCSSLP